MFELKHILLIFSLFSFGILYSQNLEKIASNYLDALEGKNPHKVIKYGEEYLSTIDRIGTASDSSIIQIRLNVTLAWVELDSVERALAFNKETYKLIKETIGLNNELALSVLNISASLHENLSNYEKALELREFILDLTESVYGLNSYYYAVSLSNLAGISSYFGKYKRALELNRKALDLLSFFGKESLDYIWVLNSIVENHYNLEEYKKSVEHNEELHFIKLKLYGKKQIEYIKSLNQLALNYSNVGNYTRALSLNLEATELLEKYFEKEYLEYLTSLNNLALNYYYLGNYSKSLELNKKALNIQEKKIEKESFNSAVLLNNIAQTYSDLGDYYRSIELNRRALRIIEKNQGKEDPTYNLILSNLANSYFKLGEYSAAVELSLDVLSYTEKVFGDEHSEYAMSLNNLALIYLELGNNNKSLELYQKSLLIIDKVYGKDHPKYLLVLSNIAVNYAYMGDYEKSLSINKEVLEHKKHILGKQHKQYVIGLNNIAFNYSKLGINEKALEYYQEALEILNKINGKEHPDYAMSLNNIAQIYHSLGNYSKARELSQKALEIEEKTLPINHPKISTNLSNLSGDNFHLKNFEKSIAQKEEAYQLSYSHFSENKYGLGNKEQLRYKSQLEDYFYTFASLAHHPKIKDSLFNLAEISDYWINLNGLLDTDQSQLTQRIYASGDSTLIALYDELKISKRELAHLNEMTLQERDINNISITDVKEKIERQEADLSRKSSLFANINRSFSTKDIAQNLEEDEIFIDIVRFPYYDFENNRWSDTVKYTAFITTNTTNSLPKVVTFENGHELEDEAFLNYAHYAFGSAKTSSTLDKGSYGYFWKPIADKIGDKKKVCLSVNGVYHDINIGTLYNPETEQYLFEEKDIRLVNNARDLILSKEKESPEFTATKVALFGFPSYETNLSSEDVEPDYITSSQDIDPLLMDSLTRGSSASPLPGTKKEVEQIAKIFDNNKWDVDIYLEENASELAVKQSENPRVLHLATHGYFFEDIPLAKGGQELRFMGIERNQALQNPLLLSGLLFAGANNTLEGDQTDGENGLLSAYEASLLQLKETELVILSACETGKGEIKNSEGVYGLRKAFSDAGAKNIIMSLWKVDDEVTQLYMTTFYDLWINQEYTIRDAFQKTQSIIKSKHPHPYYWGAFILIEN